jgi:hypothetical protein
LSSRNLVSNHPKFARLSIMDAHRFATDSGQVFTQNIEGGAMGNVWNIYEDGQLVHDNGDRPFHPTSSSTLETLRLASLKEQYQRDTGIPEQLIQPTGALVPLPDWHHLPLDRPIPQMPNTETFRQFHSNMLQTTPSFGHPFGHPSGFEEQSWINNVGFDTQYMPLGVANDTLQIADRWLADAALLHLHGPTASHQPWPDVLKSTQGLGTMPLHNQEIYRDAMKEQYLTLGYPNDCSTDFQNPDGSISANDFTPQTSSQSWLYNNDTLRTAMQSLEALDCNVTATTRLANICEDSSTADSAISWSQDPGRFGMASGSSLPQPTTHQGYGSNTKSGTRQWDANIEQLDGALPMPSGLTHEDLLGLHHDTESNLASASGFEDFAVATGFSQPQALGLNGWWSEPTTGVSDAHIDIGTKRGFSPMSAGFPSNQLGYHIGQEPSIGLVPDTEESGGLPGQFQSVDQETHSSSTIQGASRANIDNVVGKLVPSMDMTPENSYSEKNNFFLSKTTARVDIQGPSKEQWEKARHRIKQLYLVEHKTAAEVRKTIMEEYKLRFK